MLKKIKVIPLADESFGVRSMCTLIETADTKILLDAGVSLASKRLGYPPHPREYQALIDCRKKISDAAKQADVITISHYHFDHHTPSYTDWFTNWSSTQIAKEIYNGKLVLTKSYRSAVNASHRRRGWMFKKTGGRYAKKLENADGKTFLFGETTLSFSKPVFHGLENPEMGWVLMASIQFKDEKIVFASDVQGPMYSNTLDKILAEKPNLVIVGGPPTYLAGFKVKKEYIKMGTQNLKNLVEKIQTTIVGHHTLRDEQWENYFQPIVDAAKEKGNRVLTAAKFSGQKNNFLEFRRRQFFETEPPTCKFENWMKMPIQERRLKRPPI